jgi:transposase
VKIRAEVCRLRCPEHGVLTEAVPWADADSRFTFDFENTVGWLAREMNKTAIERLMKIAWRTVGRIVTRVVGRNLDTERLEDLYSIGVDEVSYRKGHRYLTVVADHGTGDVVWIGEKRSSDTLRSFFQELGPERCSQLKVVTIDMSEAYIKAVREEVPDAEIAFDPFHVVKLANEAVHDVRRDEARERKGSLEAKILKGSRWTLLKAPENLGEAETLKLAEVSRINRRVYRAYLLKEELRTLYDCAADKADTHLDAWLAWASRSKLKPFVRLARTIRRHRVGVLAAIRLGVSNGLLEGLNNKIKVIQRRSYGFHSVAALFAMIFLCCGNVPVQLPI